MIYSGQQTVASAGTAVRISDDEATRLFIIRAHPDNTGVVAIGNDGADDLTVSNGLVLAKTDPPIQFYGRLYDLFVDAATNGDKVTWLAIAGIR